METSMISRHTTETELKAWLDLVAAVQCLNSNGRPGLSVDTAISEAVQQAVRQQIDTRFGDRSSGMITAHVGGDAGLQQAMHELLAASPAAPPAGRAGFSTLLTTAIATWTRRMADLHNEGQPWPHPAPQAGWPKVLDVPG